MMRRAAFVFALSVTLLAACSGGAPSPTALPPIADQSFARGCACVERNRCVVSDAGAFESQSETRNFQCRRDDNDHATCTSETRLTPNVPWARTTMRFRRAGDQGWCWTERSGAF